MRRGVALCLLVSIATASLCARGQTQSGGVDSYEEYAKRIHAAQEIAPLSDSIFGDQVSLYNGATTFKATDISIPGNSPLPVALSRELVIRDLRLQPQNGDGLLGFGDWNLDVPYIDGTFTQDYGWTLRAGDQPSTNRCSNNTDLPYTYVNSNIGPIYVYPQRIWNGNELHIPGEGSQTLLVNNQSKSYAYTNGAYTGSSVWKWVTTRNWKLRCVSSVTGMAGEGFTAVSPTGVSYTFNYAVTKPTSALAHAYSDQYGSYAAQRVRIFLLATHVQDRFGNWVNYTYSGNHLAGITANDGRSIALTWSGDTITSVTSALGTWRYGYATASWTNKNGYVVTWPYLSTVTRPDGSKWTYTVNSGALVTNKNTSLDDTKLPPEYCQNDLEFMEDPNSGSFQYTIGAPSGASAAYSFTFIREFRDMVPLGCSRNPDPNTNYPIDATDFFDTFSLTSKQVSGPGLTTALYAYSGYSISIAPAYSYPEASAPYPNSGNPEPYEPPISCSGCPLSKMVTVKGPTSITKYTYGIQYARNEGQLLQTQVTDLSNNVLKTTSYTYVSDAQAPGEPFPDIAGLDLLPNYISPMTNRNRPVAKTVITQEGVTFTTSVSGFNVLARATGATESSSLGSRTTATAYAYNPWLWTLDQPLSQSVNGVVASQTDYNSQAEPVHTWKFGKLAVTRAHNADGTLASVTDGNNHATTLSNWKRGIPQTIGYADGTSDSATVNDAGWITAITDENGYMTSYGYDAMGRLASITYPTGDDVAWNQTLLSFAPIAGSEYGIPAGHWKQTVHTGNGYVITYFDAMWRPLVRERYDSGNKAATLSQTVNRFDAGGRTIFTSYPVSNVSNYATANSGTHTSYDALNRAIQVQQDSELGLLTTTTQYLSGFLTKVTNPRGYVTTTSYQAYGEPTTEYPDGVTAPEGRLTVIMRDAFGKPLSITRTGTAQGTPEVTRYYVYDGYQQLCKRVDPESDATAFGYDNAGNVLWRASGLNLLGTTTCDAGSAYSSGRRVDRTWDARNRLSTLSFPDGNGNQTWTYTLDGLPAQVVTANAGNTITNNYFYDKRRLMVREQLLGPIDRQGANAGNFVWSNNYGHDANGSLSSSYNPKGTTVAYAPNALGQPTRAGNYATGASYYPDGALKQFTYGNGIVHTMTENTRGLPARLTDSGAQGQPTSQDAIYTYDADGDVSAINDVAATNFDRSMTYDALDRLTGVYAALLGGQYNHAYDVWDNLRTLQHIGGSTSTYNYDGHNRLASISNTINGTFAYNWDVQGNLASGGGRNYQFDYGNRLRQVPGSESYMYDAYGHRVEQVGVVLPTIFRQYTYTGLLSFESDERNGAMRAYVYLGPRLVAIQDYTHNSVAYPIIDALRSMIAQTDATAHVDHFNIYHIWGSLQTGSLSDGPGYAGQVHDTNTGLSYAQQRYYDPNIPGFLSVDPVDVDPDTGANFNRYWYANDNPYTNIDPNGRDCTSKNGTTTCTIQVTGSLIPKTIAFATPRGVSGTQKSSAWSEHLYDIRTPNGGKSDQSVQRSIVNNPTPGSSDKPATPNGTLNYASPGGGRGNLAAFSAFLSLGHDDPRSPVKSYSFTDNNGNTWAINVTEPTHGFHFGYVLRGSVNGQTISIGEGWAWKQKAPILGTYADDVWKDQNQRNINEAH